MSKLPYVVAFLSPQGGSGKTTLCVNVAVELSNMGKNVLLVDTYSDALFCLGLERHHQSHSRTIQAADFARHNKRLSIYRTSCYMSPLVEDLFYYLTTRRKRYDYVLVDLTGSTQGAMSTVLAHTDRAIIAFRGGDISRDTSLGTVSMDIAKVRHDGNANLDVNFIVTRLRETSRHVIHWREFFDENPVSTFPFYTVDTVYEDEAVLQSKAFTEVRPEHRNAETYRKVAEKLFSCTPPKPQRSSLVQKKYRELLSERIGHPN
jgi:cellulose biosynthesis protein BcsQ